MRTVLLSLSLFVLSACAEFPKHTRHFQDGNSNAVIRPGESISIATYLSRGGDPDALVPGDVIHGQIQDSLLSDAIKSDRFEIARLLLDKGANPEGASGEHEFPLWWAARSGDLAITKELVTRGANLDTQREGNGTTALHAAIYFDHPKIVRYLIESGADVNKPTRDLNPWGVRRATPLELARKLKHAECERALVGK